MVALGINTDGPATLIVAWRSGKKAHGRVVKAGGDVITKLQEYARQSISTINEHEGQPYDPDDEQDEDKPYLETDQSELLDVSLLGVIKKAASLDLISSQELKQKTLALYALSLGKDPDHPTILIRRGSPIQLATKGLVAIFDPTLNKVSSPVLAFDSKFDLLLTSRQVYILNQKNFEALFKESAAVLANTSEWVDELSTSLPILDESKEWLKERLTKNSKLRRKVQSILRSKYLSSLSTEVLELKMLDRGLDPDRLLRDGKIVIDKATEYAVLQLLNEDLWTGDFSGEQYAASRKSRRGA